MIARVLGVASRPRKTMTLNDVKRKTAKHKDPYLYGLAIRWLQFMGRLQHRPTPLTPQRRSKRSPTIWSMRGNCHPRPFFTVVGESNDCSGDCVSKAILFARSLLSGSTWRFQKLLEPGGYSRETIRGWADALRAFFRFAESRGWCRKGLAGTVRSPRVFSQCVVANGAIVGGCAAVARHDRQ